jgi:hypothetical protein
LEKLLIAQFLALIEPIWHSLQVNHRAAFRLRVVFGPKATGTPTYGHFRED